VGGHCGGRHGWVAGREGMPGRKERKNEEGKGREAGKKGQPGREERKKEEEKQKGRRRLSSTKSLILLTLTCYR
jgi:hypothetical protein